MTRFKPLQSIRKIKYHWKLATSVRVLGENRTPSSWVIEGSLPWDCLQRCGKSQGMVQNPRSVMGSRGASYQDPERELFGQGLQSGAMAFSRGTYLASGDPEGEGSGRTARTSFPSLPLISCLPTKPKQKPKGTSHTGPPLRQRQTEDRDEATEARWCSCLWQCLWEIPGDVCALTLSKCGRPEASQEGRAACYPPLSPGGLAWA